MGLLLTYRATHEGWPTCPLAVFTQPPRELCSAIFLADGGNEQAKSLCLASLVSCSFSPVKSVGGTAAIPSMECHRK